MPVIDAIHRHTSIRQYQDKPVSDELLEEILQAGIRASSSGNMQAYSIIVTRSPELREKLYQPHMEQSMVRDAPVLLTFCADFNRMRRWLELSEAPDNFDNQMSFMIAAIDACLVSQTVALAAESRGLGLCYMGSTLANADQVGELLELPEHVVPVVGYSLGWPDEAPAPRDRLPLSGLVHQETYQDYSDAQIQDIYAEREQKGWERYMAMPELKKMVEEAGVENLAQLYTQVKYSKASHQEFSRKLTNYLKKQGFMNNMEL